MRKLALTLAATALAVTGTIATAPTAQAADYTRNGITIWNSWPDSANSRSTQYRHYVRGQCRNGQQFRAATVAAGQTSWTTYCWGRGGLALIQGVRASDNRVMASLLF